MVVGGAVATGEGLGLERVELRLQKLHRSTSQKLVEVKSIEVPCVL